MLVSAAMIRLTVQKAARKRGIKTAYQLAQRMDGVVGTKPEPFTEEVARRLWGGEVQPKLDTLSRVIEALGCEISELLRYIPDRRTKTSPQKRSKKVPRNIVIDASDKQIEKRQNHRHNGGA